MIFGGRPGGNCGIILCQTGRHGIELKINILGSGSSGNATFIEAGSRGVLLDAGLSCRQVLSRAAALGADLSRAAGIVISHDHSDHTRGVPLISSRLDIPVFVNRPTHQALLERECRGRQAANGGSSWSGMSGIRYFDAGETLAFDGLSVRTFSVCHDAADPVGFVITWEGWRVGVVTDVGRTTRLLEERLKGCHALVIEANHDIEMLDAGPYPPELKRRIKGHEGHLSNDQCAELLKKLFHPGLGHVALAHLSEENNTPVLAHTAACRCLSSLERPPRIVVATQGQPISLNVTPREEVHV